MHIYILEANETKTLLTVQIFRFSVFSNIYQQLVKPKSNTSNRQFFGFISPYMIGNINQIIGDHSQTVWQNLPTTVHQKIWFPTPNKIGNIYQITGKYNQIFW
jgi:hypothetical protein